MTWYDADMWNKIGVQTLFEFTQMVLKSALYNAEIVHEQMNEMMNEWNDWLDEWMTDWMSEQINKWTNEQMFILSEWMKSRMNVRLEL